MFQAEFTETDLRLELVGCIWDQQRGQQARAERALGEEQEMRPERESRAGATLGRLLGAVPWICFWLRVTWGTFRGV